MSYLDKFISIPPHIAYYMHLDKPHVIKRICYRFNNQPIIYGIRCVVTGMLYVGCTFVPQERFYQHLVSGMSSNMALQQAIKQHGLNKFTVLVFEEVEFPNKLPFSRRREHLTSVESRYIVMFPKGQLYNSTHL